MLARPPARSAATQESARAYANGQACAPDAQLFADYADTLAVRPRPQPAGEPGKARRTGAAGPIRKRQGAPLAGTIPFRSRITLVRRRRWKRISPFVPPSRYRRQIATASPRRESGRWRQCGGGDGHQPACACGRGRHAQRRSELSRRRAGRWHRPIRCSSSRAPQAAKDAARHHPPAGQGSADVVSSSMSRGNGPRHVDRQVPRTGTSAPASPVRRRDGGAGRTGRARLLPQGRSERSQAGRNRQVPWMSPVKGAR